MPISLANMSSYPGGSIKSPEWLAIRAFIRARAGDCCEECGVRHLTYGVRIEDDFTDLGLDKYEAECEYEHALAIVKFRGVMAEISVPAMPPLIRIVCTVAHLDHDTGNNHETNLRFWCQKHHLGHDAAHHASNARVTRAGRVRQGALL